jgi:hypothetical protein
MKCFGLFYGLAATDSETQFRLGTNADVALAQLTPNLMNGRTRIFYSASYYK